MSDFAYRHPKRFVVYSEIGNMYVLPEHQRVRTATACSRLDETRESFRPELLMPSSGGIS